MSVYDVLVGDILSLEPGEIIPVDGVYLSGHNIRCDESGATGESDAVRKATFEEIQAGGESMKKVDPFLISGSKVLEGVGKYVVTCVGRNSFHGRIMMCESSFSPIPFLLRDTEADSPLCYAFSSARRCSRYSASNQAQPPRRAHRQAWFSCWSRSIRRSHDSILRWTPSKPRSIRQRQSSKLHPNPHYRSHCRRRRRS